MSNQQPDKIVDAKTNAIALAFFFVYIGMHLCAAVWQYIHILCTQRRTSFLYCCYHHHHIDSFIHPFSQSFSRFSFLVWLVWFCLNVLQIVSSHCGWHALFWLTLLSFDCNFIQKIRFSMFFFYILAWWMCVCECVYVCLQFMYIIYIFGFLITCRGVLLHLNACMSFFLWLIFFCFQLRFGFYILFWYLVLPFVPKYLSAMFSVQAERNNCALLFNKYTRMYNICMIKIVIFLGIKHYYILKWMVDYDYDILSDNRFLTPCQFI